MQNITATMMTEIPLMSPTPVQIWWTPETSFAKQTFESHHLHLALGAFADCEICANFMEYMSHNKIIFRKHQQQCVSSYESSENVAGLTWAMGVIPCWITLTNYGSTFTICTKVDNWCPRIVWSIFNELYRDRERNIFRLWAQTWSKEDKSDWIQGYFQNWNERKIERIWYQHVFDLDKLVSGSRSHFAGRSSCWEDHLHSCRSPQYQGCILHDGLSFWTMGHLQDLGTLLAEQNKTTNIWKGNYYLHEFLEKASPEQLGFVVQIPSLWQVMISFLPFTQW